ncbi:Tat pathway signal sequence domain protein, partial [Lentilactobacillus kisonensis F0435]
MKSHSINIRTAPQSRNLHVSTYRKNSKTRNFLDRRLTLRFLTALLCSLILGQLLQA